MQITKPKSDDIVWAPQPGSQEAYLTCPLPEVLYEGTRGPGKGQPLDEPVLTPTGWKLMGELSVGDRVCTPNGRNADIDGVYPQGKRPVYKITFDDGSWTRCDDSHMWSISDGAQGAYKLLSTLEVLERVRIGDVLCVPAVKTLTFDRTSVQFDPYMFARLMFGAVHYDGQTIVKTRGVVDTLDLLQYPGAVEANGHVVMPDASWCGMSRIPVDLMTAPEEDRLAFVQGIFDAVGYKEHGYYRLNNINARLITPVLNLLRTLGLKARELHDADSIIVSPSPRHLFRNERLLKPVSGHNSRGRDIRRVIKAVDYIGDMETQCIHINERNHLYITRDYIVTHNTDCLIMDYAQHVGMGFGSHWRGIIFRQTYKQLADVITKSKRWFYQIWGTGAKFNASDSSWTFPDGEQLLFRQFLRDADYWNYHGHEYPFIGWEELCNWPTDHGFKQMMSTNRSSYQGELIMPRKIRATTNPYGPGHNWVKFRYRLPGSRFKVIRDSRDDEGNIEPPRVAIHGHIYENKILLAVEPDYVQKIKASARNEAERKAWVDGNWDIVAGGMFDDVWHQPTHVMKAFNIPHTWKIKRSFDWGSSKPFSVGWWAISDGSDYADADGKIRSSVRGDAFRIAEWYGWNGKPNEGLRLLAAQVTKGILERELLWGFIKGPPDQSRSYRVKPGPADSSIFDIENGTGIAKDMGLSQRIDGKMFRGVEWERADKRPGSRKQGWETMRKAFQNAKREDGLPREKPGIFIFANCEQFLRTIPVLPRDDKDQDDVNTEAEDHIADEARYFVRSIQFNGGTGSTTGMY